MTSVRQPSSGRVEGGSTPYRFASRVRFLHWFGSVLATAWLSLALAACGHQKPKATPAAQGPARSVTTAEGRRSAGGEATGPAIVQARQRATLSARIPASVVELPFREGERVELGAVVVRLDDAALRSAVSAAEAGVKAAETDQARIDALFH